MIGIWYEAFVIKNLVISTLTGEILNPKDSIEDLHVALKATQPTTGKFEFLLRIDIYIYVYIYFTTFYVRRGQI